MEDFAKIEAYDPDDLCEIEFSANVDFLEIGENGEIKFTRDLSPEEVLKIDRKIVEIKANEVGSEEFSKIPLILSSL